MIFDHAYGYGATTNEALAAARAMAAELIPDIKSWVEDVEFRFPPNAPVTGGKRVYCQIVYRKLETFGHPA